MIGAIAFVKESWLFYIIKNLNAFQLLNRPSVYQKINFLISQPKHDVGTQKNLLSERVLLNTHKHMLN